MASKVEGARRLLRARAQLGQLEGALNDSFKAFKLPGCPRATCSAQDISSSRDAAPTRFKQAFANQSDASTVISLGTGALGLEKKERVLGEHHVEHGLRWHELH